MIAQRLRVRLVAGRAVEPIGLITLRARNGIDVALEPRRTSAGAKA
jgi:hypothetical protein